MEWHQPWLLQVPLDELEDLLNECRTRAKDHVRAQRYGLGNAWNGLSHEIVERMIELQRELAGADIPGQLALETDPPGAYGEHGFSRRVGRDHS